MTSRGGHGEPPVRDPARRSAVRDVVLVDGVRLMTRLARQFEEDLPMRYGRTPLCVGLGRGAIVPGENPHHEHYGQDAA